MILRVAIIGFGNVGQEFAKMLLSERDWLLKSKGLDIEVVAISTRSRGALISDRALDLERALNAIQRDGTLSTYDSAYTDLSPIQIIERTVADMMVELTTLDIDSGQPATDHIAKALGCGLDVVTANKGPIAHAYNELRALARSRGVHLRFEGTVMDGAPVFSLVERTLPGCEVIGLTGILNSTSNFILTEMAAGKTKEEAVSEAQRRGFAEADPSLDLDGWDAAAKITALAHVMMGANLKPNAVDRTGIGDVTVESLTEAKASGEKVRLIATAKRIDGEVMLKVAPERIRSDIAFWTVDGTSSALTISTDLMGDITILEQNPSVTQTAYAVFSDLIHIVESIRSGTV